MKSLYLSALFFFFFIASLLTKAISQADLDWHHQLLGEWPGGGSFHEWSHASPEGLMSLHIFLFPSEKNSKNSTNSPRKSTYSDYHLGLIDNPTNTKSIRELFKENQPKGSLPSNSLDHPLIDDLCRKKNSTSAQLIGIINGGYFHPDGTPLGLLEINGHQIHPWHQASLLSGIMAITPTSLHIIRSDTPLPSNTISALQAGPFLVDQGKVIPSLETTKIAKRSFIATDGEGHWALGTLSPQSLAQTAHLLLELSPQLFPKTGIKEALNLDGGSSTSLILEGKTASYQEGDYHIVRDCIGVFLNCNR